MISLSKFPKAFLTCSVAIILAGCNTTTDISYEPETQLSDGKVVEVTQIKKPNKISPRLEAKLAQRKTINQTGAWSGMFESEAIFEKRKSNYGFVWNWYKPTGSLNSFKLTHLEWHYHEKKWEWLGKPYPPQFLRTSVPYSYSAFEEHTQRYWNDLTSQELPKAILNNWAVQTDGASSDGVFFDFWHNKHPIHFNETVVRNARKDIAKEFRNQFGDQFIIAGNVNWEKDVDTISYLNGVFLELFKDDGYRVYNSSELRKIENLLEYYEKNLQHPKLIALEGWRATASLNDKDRNTPENRKMAKLLTAMSVVLPTNGYILYADNNQDTPNYDHAHLNYDFYSFDIGKPTGPRVKVSNGVSYKQHQEGFIAYNITSRAKSFEINGSNRTVSIEPKSGLFCKETGDAFDCLTVD